MSEQDYESATAHIRPRRGGGAAAVAFAGALLLAFALYRRGGPARRETPYELIGKPAPAFTLRRLDTGAPMSLDQMRGRPVVLNIWAPWCGPCRSEHGVLLWASQRFGTQVQFAGIVYESPEADARKFLKEHGVPFPELVDPEARVAAAYGVTGVPETFFIDAAGTIHHKHIGPISQQEFIEEVQSILGDTAQQ